MLAIIEEGLTNAVGAYEDKDPKSAMQVLAQTLSRIAEDVPHSRDTDLTQTTSERLERYKSYKDFDGGLRGIPSGFASIDRATLGFQNGQLVTMVGPPKAGKSTIELLAAMAAHDYGEEPLLIGFEMPNEEQEERFDAIFSRISHKRLRSGELRKPEWDRLESAMVRLKDMQAFLLSSDSNSATTLTGVASKIEVLQPTILFVDGVYMMDDENGERKGSPQALTNITRGFKRMAMNLDIPIVISTQALSYKVSKKDGITADSIGYSSSFAQDSDVIIGVNKTDDEDINEISIVLARNAPKMKTFVQWDWETGRFEELDDDPFGGDGDPDF